MMSKGTTTTSNFTNNNTFTDLDTYLEQRLGPGPIPLYERTPETLTILNQHVQEDILICKALHIRDQSANALLNVLASSIKSTESYLSSLGIDHTRFSQPTLSALETLTEIALDLELADVSPVSMISALTSRQLQVYEAWKSKYLQKKSIDSTAELSQYFSTQAKYFQNQIDTNAATLDTKLEEQAAFADRIPHLDAKLVEYQEKLAAFSANSTVLSIPEINQLAREVSCLEQTLNENEKKLDTLKDIPPDPLLVQLQLEDAQYQLEKLKLEREKLLLNLSHPLSSLTN